MTLLCKRCGGEREEVTTADRERYDAVVVAAFAVWARTPAFERGTDDTVSRHLARASAYAELCLAADRGLCVTCLQEGRT